MSKELRVQITGTKEAGAFFKCLLKLEGCQHRTIFSTTFIDFNDIDKQKLYMDLYKWLDHHIIKGLEGDIE